MIAALLHERFGLREGLTAAGAAGILWTLTAPGTPPPAHSPARPEP